MAQREGSADVYITSLGTFLPGPPIDNDQMEDYLGRIHGRPSRVRARVLQHNGILTRHYALDRKQRTIYRNSEMAARAVHSALAGRPMSPAEVDFLAAATTQPDLPVPGFASMVHGELGTAACEIATLQGACASGVMALKSAYLQVKAGGKRAAVVCASELPSRLFKASRFERQVGPDGTLPFDTELLRWMLSDGAGAAVLEPEPRRPGLSLAIDWIEIQSHAGRRPPCMYAGANKNTHGTLGRSWLDYPSFEEAARDGAINLKQDLRQLEEVVKVGVDGFFALCEAGRLDPAGLDWIVCHYCSHFFRDRIFQLLERGGVQLPPERWFTNLYSKGNTGSAAVYVMLDELLTHGDLRPGQKIFVMVPESGRFLMAYLLLTVVSGRATPVAPAPTAPTLVQTRDSPVAERLVRQLTRVQVDFETALRTVPVVARLQSGRFTLADYRLLLSNLRQQAVDGARWIARATSQLDGAATPLRTLFVHHAGDERRDSEMLERDYVSIGGALPDLQNAPKNVGSETLSAWMFHRAGRDNPLDLLGALWLIQRLRARVARRWGVMIRDQLGLTDRQLSFLLYHGGTDDHHLGKLDEALGSGLVDERLAEAIVRTARVTARLYCLQLEEMETL
jgi:3-oxoacyl-[acyl-carrier-protein] synthase-3